ncbi:MAG: universal stress protein [Desulfobacteraceae bacterium]|nr:MAG: universal stress protein [Desulfobacteraceae bacterium]
MSRQYGKPAREICDYADRNDIDLVVMTSHGFGRALQWALGSVADKVVRHCPKPVLVVKQPKK